ncbi:membrane protein [Carbonactinospora thermoautotrophica]|uniref:Probable membrane transporter protein n=2 Tax=Carbonactinospora thermoautotrophica TaxID=1469144 RepID=A0A132MUG0_9ACTN|nr:sulfite exporter TauE/SafE family protein [Carbonactinospora thermoautotrophica]KWX00391.1 membrane protein [Carbonactinospora thermoautotrophica]KWX01545.1 Uncharacterized protein LI90_2577 [Carbonactinospora thermoautotrophica]
MTLLEGLGVLVAGLVAGTVNTVVGAGTLVTFPVLLAVGYPPVIANVSNTVGLVFGSLSGALGYRRELDGQRSRLLRLGCASLLGGLSGGILLLTLPPGAFEAIVPALILLSCVLVLVQPWLARRVARPHHTRAHGGPLLFAGVYAAGIYGGYFGAAQGVLLIGLLGLLLDEDLQRVNAAKNVLALLVNFVSAVLFVVVADVDWRAAALIAVGSTVGGQLGALVGRRLPPVALRAFVVTVGVAAVVRLLAV